MFATTVAGSLPKPLWLAEPEKLSPAWRLEGNALAAAKIDATILAVRRQEDAGIDIVRDGEQARVHFVHGFLANRRRRFRPPADDRHPRRPLQGRGHICFVAGWKRYEIDGSAATGPRKRQIVVIDYPFGPPNSVG